MRYFHVYRDGTKTGQVEYGHSDYGDAASGTPAPLRFADPTALSTARTVYQVTQVNWSGLESAKSRELVFVDGHLSASRSGQQASGRRVIAQCQSTRQFDLSGRRASATRAAQVPARRHVP